VSINGTSSADFCAVRELTEELAAPLSGEDQTAQSMPDVSPTKWHRAHTTWFFETFVLERFEAGFEAFEPSYRMLFNSYYETIGEQYPRPRRGVITRPGVAEVAAYRHEVDRRVRALLDNEDLTDQMAELVRLGLHHEQQHQELMLMDIKHVLSQNPLEPAYRPQHSVDPPRGTRPSQWVEIGGGVVEVGHAGATFAFDNEQPRHRVFIEPFALADRLVTAGDWMQFVDDGGYRRPELWLSDGWHTMRAEDWTAPLYWRPNGDCWMIHTLGGTRPILDDEPVSHVSYYEADAYARWAGARLPTEFEWEHAATSRPSAPSRRFDLDGLHPVPAPSDLSLLSQLAGECWQWTASAHLPYPGFTPAPGAVGEYNGKFMSGQMVLRGASALTPPGHDRPTYRNFFPPAARWPMTGVRLATGGAPR